MKEMIEKKQDRLRYNLKSITLRTWDENSIDKISKQIYIESKQQEYALKYEQAHLKDVSRP